MLRINLSPFSLQSKHLDGVLFFRMADCTWKRYFREIKPEEIYNILFSLKTKRNVSANISLGLAIKQRKQWSTKYRNNFMSTWLTYFSERRSLSKMLIKLNSNWNLKLRNPSSLQKKQKTKKNGNLTELILYIMFCIETECRNGRKSLKSVYLITR